MADYTIDHKSPRFYDTDDDEFHDAFEAGIKRPNYITQHFSFNVYIVLYRLGYRHIKDGRFIVQLAFRIIANPKHASVIIL